MGRKLLALMVLILVLVGFVAPPRATADSPIRVMVNGQYLTNMDVQPTNIGGRVFTPARFIAEALGATVEWDAQNSTVVIVNRPSTPPRWSMSKGVIANLTDDQIQDAILYGVANKDKTWDEFFKGYFSRQPAWGVSLENTAILRTEWLEVAATTQKAEANGKSAPTMESARTIFKPEQLTLEVWMWGDSDTFASYVEAYLKQGNQIIKPYASRKNISQGNTGYFQQPGIPSHYGDNLYFFSTNGLDLSGNLEAIVLSSKGEESRFSWKLVDLK